MESGDTWDARRLYHVDVRDYHPGDVKARGLYGEGVLAHVMGEGGDDDGELLRERIRADFYPAKPSRLSSSFVFENIEHARTFRDAGRPGARIYEVQFVADPKAIHRVCMTMFTMNHFSPELQAHEFWNDPPTHGLIELFAEVDIVIVREICCDDV